MTTEQFIDALEDRELVAGDLARQLRAKAGDGDGRVTPQAILKFLVKTDALTQWKADEIGAELLDASSDEPSPAPESLELAPLGDDDDADERPSRPSARPIEPPPILEPPRRGRPTDANEEILSLNPVTRKAPATADELFGADSGSKPATVYRLGGKKGKKTKRTAGGKNQWDSPLLLLGGGALVVLAIGGALLYYLIFRESADAVLADANRLFESEAYSQAVARYEEFVTNYSSHKDASHARVRLQLTRLYQAVDGGGDPSTALATARAVIAEIEDETAFVTSGGEGSADPKQELSGLLLQIGDALVARAEKSTDPKEIEKLIADIEAVLALSSNTKYVPEKFRSPERVQIIADALGVIRTRQMRDARLAATLQEMSTAVAAGDSSKAYAARLTLLSEYPALADDESLAAQVLATSAAEQARVKFAPNERAAETAWPPSSVVAELTLAERRGADGAPATGAPVVVRVDGALYGLRSGDGAVLWRRHAGLGSTSEPLTLEGGDIAAADLAGGELWRLEAATGELEWRLPLGERVSGIVSSGARLLATSDAGKLFVIDAASGALAGHVEFTQPIRAAPAVNDRGSCIYVVAEHSIVYTLSADDLSCLGVFYLGHAAGAVAAPPVAILDKVIIADNTGTETSRIRVLTVDERGVINGEAASERLDGLVLTPLANVGRRLAAVTTRGAVAVVEIAGGGGASALAVVAKRDGLSREPAAEYCLLEGGSLWIAGRQLSNLEIRPTENQLAAHSMETDYHGDAFDAPLKMADRLLIHVRRPAGRAGAIVAATDAAAGRAAWETEIAVPLAGAPAVNPSQMVVTAATASGAAYVLDRQALARGVQDRASRATPSSSATAPLTEAADLGGGRLAAAAMNGAQVLIVDAANPQQPATSMKLAGALCGGLVAWRDGFLSPTDVGQVFYIVPGQNAPPVTPFQPTLTPGRKYEWLRPAVVGEGDATQFVVSDGQEQLHLVALESGAPPHLTAVKSVDVGPAPLTSRLAVVGSTVYAGTDDGRLMDFALPDLMPGNGIEIGGRVAWGPHAVGGGLLLASDAGELLFVAGGGVRWRQPVAHGALAGEPLAAGGTALVLHNSGRLSTINLTDGAETSFVEVGKPAIAGPVALGERVIVVAPDGTMLVVNRP
jgi:outer membrane protein assembly factor BamB